MERCRRPTHHRRQSTNRFGSPCPSTAACSPPPMREPSSWATVSSALAPDTNEPLLTSRRLRPSRVSVLRAPRTSNEVGLSRHAQPRRYALAGGAHRAANATEERQGRGWS